MSSLTMASDDFDKVAIKILLYITQNYEYVYLLLYIYI